MKRLLLLPLVFFGLGLCRPGLQAQIIADFESLLPLRDTFLSGPEYTNGWTQYCSLTHNWDTDFNYWSGGWAVSSKFDTLNGTFTNLYGVKNGSGFNGSNTYLIGQQNAGIGLKYTQTNNQGQSAVVRSVPGFLYLTNTTYAYEVLRTGNGFAKKMGGLSGNDPDFFKLTIRGYSNGTVIQDSVEFYLADYRFQDNRQDYIVKDWSKVDISRFQFADSLSFELSSSDVGQFGINTPLFFAVDHITFQSTASTGGPANVSSLGIYPNPATDWVEIGAPLSMDGIEVRICNLEGRQVGNADVLNGNLKRIDTSSLQPGVYVLHFTSGKRHYAVRLIKA